MISNGVASGQYRDAEGRNGNSHAETNCEFVIVKLIRSVTIGLLIAFLSAYVAYCINTTSTKLDLQKLQFEIAELKELMGTPIMKSEISGIDDCSCPKRKNEDDVDRHRVITLLQEELKSFDADRTGMTDFAMKALGGSVVSTLGTEDFHQHSGDSKLWISNTKNERRSSSTILEANVLPGDCWAFRGKKGSAVIKLFAKIVVTNVTLEHIPKNISPSGDISTAPRIFSLVGLDNANATTGHNFGSFIYKEYGPPIQSFPVRFTFVPPFEYVRIDFQENQGNEEFTCVYRVRIHGCRSLVPIRSDRLPDDEACKYIGLT